MSNPSEPNQLSKVQATTKSEASQFFEGLESVYPESVVLTAYKIRESNNHESVDPRPLVRKLPPTLTSLYDIKYSTFDSAALAMKCESIFKSGIVMITNDEAAYLEECTRLQSESLLWHQHRVGRITASKFHQVSRASINPPPTSLVKALMNTNTLKSTMVPSLNWGICNEAVAREAYLAEADGLHDTLV